MRLVTTAALVALVSGCDSATTGLATSPLPALAPLPASVTSELPRNARPWHYTIEVAPNAAALSFTGHVDIDLELFEAGTTITLNSVGLDLSSASIAPIAGGDAVPLAFETDEEAETATFTSPAPLAPGKYRVAIDYSGPIGRSPSGFFALDYPDKLTGEPSRALFTQFEVPDAREFAPLFDEPSYKANFDLSAIVPVAQTAVSNMPVVSETPLGDGTMRVVFGTSPKMSSYLLFFGLGNFERMVDTAGGGTEIGIVSPVGSGDTARYALDAAKEILPFYNDYFGVAYPLPKLDNVAGPGTSQQFGAMENWGAIFTFETSLLLDPRSTSPDRQRYLYTALGHEMAHQWFGDLVTMAWWDDLWLNEGFASWVEDKVTEHFKPDWNVDVGRVNSRESAMARDALASTHPLVLHSKSAYDADQNFDAIAYSKGATVLAMFEDFAGKDTWRDGIRRYMARHAYKNTETADLWNAMEEAGATGLTRIADSYTRIAGVPLVTASTSCSNGQTRLDLSQSEFSLDRRAEVARNPGKWLVPMRIVAADGSEHPLLLDGAASLELPGCGPVVVNGGQVNYFRTLYSPDMLAALIAKLPELSPVDQLGLVRDNLALADGGYQDYAPALDMFAALEGDANPYVIEIAADVWTVYYDKLADEDAKARMGLLLHYQFLARLESLGYEPRPGESLADNTLRAELIDDLGKTGDAAVVAEARRRFALLSNDPHALDGPLRSTWLGIVARNASVEDWDLLKRLAVTAPTSIERQVYIPLLAAARDEVLAMKSLELALSDAVQPDEAIQLVRGVSVNHGVLAYDFYVAHQAQLDPLVDQSARPAFLPRLLRSEADEALIERLEILRDSRPLDERSEVEHEIVSMKSRLETYPRLREQLGAWLATRY